MMAECSNKPIKRLWVLSFSENAIKRGFGLKRWQPKNYQIINFTENKKSLFNYLKIKNKIRLTY